MKKAVLLFFCLAAWSCARGPLKDPNQLYRPSLVPSELSDMESAESLQLGLKRLLAVYDTSSNIPQEFRFGERVISREEYKSALMAAAAQAGDLTAFSQFIRDNFDFFEVYGSSEGWGDVLATAYYAPLLKGSHKKTKQYTRALYKTPSDLVTVDLQAFAEKHPEVDWLKKLPPWVSQRQVLRGQLVASATGPVVVPYLERKQIDVLSGKSPLADKKLEIVWVDPVDAFYLQIQGSGMVEVGKDKFLVGYDKQNGYTWFPIGKALTDVIPVEQMSMQRVRAYLASLPPEKLQETLNNDPSYVFFRKMKGFPVGYSGAEVSGQRAIATDASLFPKGTLAFLDIEVPVYSSPEQLDPERWERKPRWVLDVDTGGAIKGPGRVDLYMGEGAAIGQMAGAMKRHGKLLYVAPKAEFLRQLKSAAN